MKINHKKMNIVLGLVIVLMAGGFLYMQNSQKQAQDISQNQINDNLKVDKQSICKNGTDVENDDKNKQSYKKVYTEQVKDYRVSVYIKHKSVPGKYEPIAGMYTWHFFEHELDLPKFTYFKEVGQNNNECGVIMFHPYIGAHGSYMQDIIASCRMIEKPGKVLDENTYGITVNYPSEYFEKISIITEDDIREILNKIEG